ncbi:hypothetical protein MUK42_33270 [Musa troglodytarum]|uniref:Uncharacterized protein n=1 Tax=Musa troglodytarum TaxID=320322 RepID=A0A9E7IFN5_9LILI|nr:hypothetical protein MUK42_33270 [Musa troglodytarum]
MTGSSGRANPSPRWIRFIPIRYQQWDPLALQVTWGEGSPPPAVRHVGAPRSAGSAFLWGPPVSVRPETTWTEDHGKVVISHAAGLPCHFPPSSTCT